MFTHILAATDFSPSSKQARELAMEIAQKFGAKLTLVHVCEIPSYVYVGAPYTSADLVTPIREGARQALDDELAEVRKTVSAATAMLREGYAPDEIRGAIAEVRADLLIMGTHGRRGLPRALLGSVAEKLVRTATIPVLTVHAT
jgi:nucleotide-binding universal stress UspA family protein